MNEVTLPPSPNWYLSNILATSLDGTVAWGANNTIVVARKKDESKVLMYSLIKNAHLDKVTSVAFSPEFGKEGKNLLVSTGMEHVVKVWNLDSLSMVYSYSYSDMKQCVIAADWSRKNCNLICCTSLDGILVAWNLIFNSGHEISLGKLNATCLACCTHNADLVAIGTKSGLVYIVSLKGEGTITYRLRGHDTEVVSLSWCPIDINVLSKENQKDLLLASGGKDRSIFLWKAGGDGRCQIELTLPSAPFTPQHQHRNKQNSPVGNWTVVSWVKPMLLLSSSNWGELIAWDLSKFTKNKPTCKLIHAGHSRGLFCIASMPLNITNELDDWRTSSSNVVWTLAQDRIIISCTVSEIKTSTEHFIPTQGGFIYCIASCPLETSRIAFGVGDAMLRIWNLSELHEKSFDITMLWQKIKGKVRAIAWHPEKENILAYGTGEGRIGIFDTNLINKPPTLLKQYHRKTVYALRWGPVEDSSKKHYALFSCSEGELVYYHPKKLNEEPISVLKKGCCEFSWKPDFSCLTVGLDNGSILFYNRHLELLTDHSLCALKKTVHCLAWHPESTATDLTISPMHNYLAVAYDAEIIMVFDVSELIELLTHSHQAVNEKDAGISNFYKVVAKLNGHVDKVVSLAWSPHFSGHLVSSSFDNTVQIWKVETQELMGTFIDHCSPVHCCMWSPLDPDLIITGSMDFTIRIWKISKQKPIMVSEISQIKKVKSKKTVVGNESKIMDQKMVQNTTYFSLYSKEMNKTAVILDIIKKLVHNKKDIGNGSTNIDDNLITEFQTLFSGEESFRDILNTEKTTYMLKEKYNTVTEMDLWNDNLKENLETALKQKRLNDFLVSLAPSLSIKMWREMCEAYANQLILEGNIRKAVSYFLSIHKPYQAIEAFQNVKMFKEAYALARCKLDSDDPLIRTILQAWTDYEISVGQFEQAAYCCIYLGNLSKAAELLGRRKDIKCLEVAAEIAVLANNNKLANQLANQIVLTSLLQSDFLSAKEIIKKFPNIKYQELYITAYSEVNEIVTEKRLALNNWLTDKVNYGLLQILSSTQEDIEVNVNFYRDINICTIPESEKELLLNTSRYITVATICKSKEKQLVYLIKALDLILQYEITHKKIVEHEDRHLIYILCNLDSKSPYDPKSIYASTDNPASKSIRSYLCLGLIDWLLMNLKKDIDNESTLPIIHLIEELFEDALDYETMKFWNITNEINKLESLLAPALGPKKEKSENDEINGNSTADLLEKLNKIKIEKAKFIDERVAAPSPILIYSKANEFLSQLSNESFKEILSNKLSQIWEQAVSKVV
ncbi:gem-associated protein 5 isoform X2 [Prorops nasuta]|uniref:gem-associated protein 5 isoform X2 n=1 Tax=Prorops nasuta TaxID=863751 RepID=UPI0034CD9680